MSTPKRKPPKSKFFKMQTKWVQMPAMIDATRHEETVCVQVFSSRQPNRTGQSAHIYLTPHETHAFASWLCEQADHLLAKQARAADRAKARAAARRARAADPEGM